MIPSIFFDNTERGCREVWQQTLFFAYPMAGLMMKRIGYGKRRFRQLNGLMPNVK